MMLHVCYMSGQHITWLNPFVHGHLSHIMLEGYMFFLIIDFRGIYWCRFLIMSFGKVNGDSRQDGCVITRHNSPPVIQVAEIADVSDIRPRIAATPHKPEGIPPIALYR